MSDPRHAPAARPEEIALLFVERANAQDADGMAALYAEDAVMQLGPGDPLVGRPAIREALAALVADAPAIELGEQLPPLVRGDLALTAVRPPEGAGRTQVCVRDADRGWRRVIDRGDG